MPPHLLGIDIGTTAVKAALFEMDGAQVARARVRCSSTGEFDPRDWWKAVCEVLDALDLSDVAAAGVCGRGGTAVLLDRNGVVMAPSWSDARAAGFVAEVRQERPELSAQATAMLAKVRWWKSERGGLPAAGVMSVKDFVNFNLTGVAAADQASGAGPLPLNEARNPWALLGHAGPAVPLAPGTPVAVGWHDGAAAAFGAGAASAGTAPVTLGTTAVYRVVASRLPGTLRKYWDLTPGLTVTGGDITGAGRAYAWARSILNEAKPARSQPGANGLTFLPQLTGRIAPDRHSDARGTWWGIDGTQSPDDMIRAVVEGTAFSLRQVRDWLAGEGLKAERTIATGGGARKATQVQALADILDCPVEVTPFEEGCRGAALLGAVAAGFHSLESARTLTPPLARFEPDTANREAYEAAYERFLAVQRATDSVPAEARERATSQ